MGNGSAARAATWLLHMALPVLALWLLLVRPQLDLAWDNRMAHFVLVFAAAIVSTVLGALIGKGASARDDARLWLVSLVFVISAGFFALHALVTPGVLMQTSDADFMLPSRVGLVLAGVVALASAVEFTPARIARVRWLRVPLTILVCVSMAACAAAIVYRVFDRLMDPALVDGAAEVAGLVGSALFAVAALAYFPLYRRRRAVVVMSC